MALVVGNSRRGARAILILANQGAGIASCLSWRRGRLLGAGIHVIINGSRAACRDIYAHHVALIEARHEALLGADLRMKHN